MSFTFHKFIHQHIYLGVITPRTKIVKTSQKKDVHFRLTRGGYTWGGPNVSETIDSMVQIGGI